jgi:hypothetical protein
MPKLNFDQATKPQFYQQTTRLLYTTATQGKRTRFLAVVGKWKRRKGRVGDSRDYTMSAKNFTGKTGLATATAAG